MTDPDIQLEQWEAEQIIESLREGIPPVGHLRHFTVGRRTQIQRLSATLAEDADPTALLLQANYGAGKTHLLRLIREVALEEGFAVALVTVDSRSGVRFNRMDQVCSAVMRSIEVPNGTCAGVGALFDTYFAADEARLTARQRRERSSISADGRWSYSSALGSKALWIALRAWHLSRSSEARAVISDWLAYSWEYNTRRQHLYQHLVAKLPPTARDTRSETDMYRANVFRFDTNGHDGAWLAIEDLHQLALLAGLRGLVLLFDEFEDVIQNLNNIGYERTAFNNLITLMNQRTFTGWAYFAVTPEFVAKCRMRLFEKMVYDYPVELFDDLERVKMTPVDEKDFLTLAALVRETHGLAYDWDARSRLPDRSLPPLVKKLFAAQQVDQVRHAMIGLVGELDRRLDG